MDWLNIVLGSSAILGAIAAIWQWLTHNYLPYRQATIEKQREYTRKQTADQQEFLQTVQSDALKAVLETERTLIDNLIGSSNSQLVGILAEISLLRKNYHADIELFRAEIATELNNMRKEIQPQLRTLADIKTQMTIVNRDWTRFNEIVADIDLVLHRLETALKIKDE